MSLTFWTIIGGVCILIWLFFWALCKSTRVREEAWKRAIAQADKDQEMRYEEGR